MLPAYALEKPVYNQKISKSSQIKITSYIHAQNNDVATDIAPIDLNDDGLYEFIVKDKSCTMQHKFCQFYILAEGASEAIEIGNITARDLAVAEKQSSGVRNLLVFQDPVNDYTSAVYVWEPERSRYILSE